MNAWDYRHYSARVEFDAEDEIFVGHIADISDIVGFHADTLPDIKLAFQAAVEDYMQNLAKAAG